MRCKKKTKYDCDFVKRFDQRLHDQFCQLSTKQKRKEGDITPSALKNIIENKSNDEMSA